MPGEAAGRNRMGGWIAPDGTFYPAQRFHHLRIGAELRGTGDGPSDPWDMRDGWLMVRAHGEVLVLPDRLTQAQLDTLGDMLTAAPDGGFRSYILEALRTLREVQTLR